MATCHSRYTPQTPLALPQVINARPKKERAQNSSEATLFFNAYVLGMMERAFFSAFTENKNFNCRCRHFFYSSDKI